MELFSPVSIINGLGPAKKVLNDKGLFTLNDFLYYFPRKHLDRTSINSINELSKGDSGTIIASVETFGEKPIRKRENISGNCLRWNWNFNLILV